MFFEGLVTGLTTSDLGENALDRGVPSKGLLVCMGERGVRPFRRQDVVPWYAPAPFPDVDVTGIAGDRVWWREGSTPTQRGRFWQSRPVGRLVGGGKTTWQ